MLLANTPVLSPVSTQAEAIYHLFMGVFWVCLAILGLVAGLVTFAMIRYRRRGQEGEPRQVFGHLRIEILWTAIPFVLLVGIFYFTANAMRISDPQEHRDPDLIVIGHQWWWEVRYPKAGIVTANEIHIPTGQRLFVQLKSADVIHSFWVPELGRKMDMIPGHPNYLWLETDRAGTYHGACSEYCGTQHAWMRFLIIAQPPTAFDTWREEMQTRPAIPASGQLARGLDAFQTKTCVNCHTIDGVSPTNSTAPELTHLADRRTLAGGVLENTPPTLTEWLKDPQSIKPGCYMPNVHLTDAEVTDLVTFLERTDSNEIANAGGIEQ